MGAQEEQFNMIADFEANVMSKMDAYIGLRSGENINEQADVPDDKMKIHGNTVGKKVHRDIRVPKTKWVVLRYPTSNDGPIGKNEYRSIRRFLF